MKYRISDMFSYSRIILVIIFSTFICILPNLLGFWGVFGIIFIFLTDSFDGYFARKYDKPDQMGSFLDITSDRVAETTLLVPFVYFGIANPFILIFFIAKGFTVDYFRLKKFAASGKVPFSQGNGILFYVVKSRIVRFSYAILKMVLIILFYCKLINLLNFPEYVYTLMSVIVIVLGTLRSIPPIINK